MYPKREQQLSSSASPPHVLGHVKFVSLAASFAQQEQRPLYQPAPVIGGGEGDADGGGGEAGSHSMPW